MTDRIIKAIQEVHEEYKGGAGSGNFGHSGRSGTVGGSSSGGGGGKGGAGKMDSGEIPLGGKSAPHAKGYSIKFDDAPGYHKLGDLTDAYIDKKLSALEKVMGKKLPRDSRTDFPPFTVYENGDEIGGG